MRCDEFQNQHCAFIDDILAGVELVRMQRHVNECLACAERDATVRRSLMLVHSLPSIELSSNFRQRLEERLRECRLHPETGSCANFKAVATFGALASLLMVGYIAQTLRLPMASRPTDVVFPPVIAIAEPPATPPPPPILGPIPSIPTARAVLASVSAGMPLWPAAFFAEQAPLYYTGLVKVEEPAH